MPVDAALLQQQITLIQNDIHSVQANSLITIGIAAIGFFGTLAASVVSAVASWNAARTASDVQKAVSSDRMKHEKQWEYFKTQMSLINSATDILWRIIYNKLVLCDHATNSAAKSNLFLLEKDAFTVESLLVVYGPESFGVAVGSMRELILSIPDKDFRKRWDEMYAEGRKKLLEIRVEMARGLEKPFEGFVSELKGTPQSLSAPADIVGVNSMGAVEIKTTLFPEHLSR